MGLFSNIINKIKPTSKIKSPSVQEKPQPKQIPASELIKKLKPKEIKEKKQKTITPKQKKQKTITAKDLIQKLKPKKVISLKDLIDKVRKKKEPDYGDSVRPKPPTPEPPTPEPPTPEPPTPEPPIEPEPPIIDDANVYINYLINLIDNVSTRIQAEIAGLYFGHVSTEVAVQGLTKARYWLEESLQLPYSVKAKIAQGLSDNAFMDRVEELLSMALFPSDEADNVINAIDDIGDQIQAIVEGYY